MTGAGSSSARDLTAALSEACTAGGMTCGALGLINNGRVTALATAGSLYRGGPEADVSTLFGLGSVVELLSAIAVARAETVQHTAWVSDYVPSVRLGKTTVQQLLSHSSGLPHASRDQGPTGRDALERFVVEDVPTHRRRTAPGEISWATPTGYAVLGRAMEVLNSRPFDELLKELVLDPAGMTSAANPSEADQSRVARPSEGSGRSRSEVVADDRSGHPSGFLFASLQDLVGLVTGILEGFLIDAATWERMASQHMSRHISHVSYPLVLAATGYGLGCQTGEWNGQRVVRRPGRQASYHCTVELLPEASSAVILLTNGADDRAFNDILNQCYETLCGRGRLGPEPALEPFDPDLATAWEGTYVQPGRGTIVKVSQSDGDLIYGEGGAEAPLYSVGEGRALVPMDYGSAPLWFPRSDGPAPYLMMWGDPYFRETLAPWSVDNLTMASGVYRDSFFPREETDLDFRFEDGSWSVTRGGKRSAAVPLGERKLSTAFGVAQFSDDGASVQVGDATVYRRS